MADAADGQNVGKATELQLAGMENRLRNMITETLQPTIHRTTIVVSDMERLTSIVSTHTRGIQELQVGQFKALEHAKTITGFRDELSRWDVQRKTSEAGVDERLENMHTSLEALKYSLEQKESALHHLHRQLDRCAAEVSNANARHGDFKKFVESRLDDLALKVGKSAAEVEVQIMGLRLQHDALTDQLWSDETGLAKVAGELKRTNATLHDLESSVTGLEESKATAAEVYTLRAEVAKKVHESNAAVADMKNSVTTVVDDVKEHFRTAGAALSAQNATILCEVRQELTPLMAKSEALRQEAEAFMKQTDDSISVMAAQTTAAVQRANSVSTEIREELEDLNKMRKRDKNSSDIEIKALKSRLDGMFGISDHAYDGIEHLRKVLQFVLEGGEILCALEAQDTLDRKRISLMGSKDDDLALARTYQSEPQHPRPEYRTPRCRGANGARTVGTLRGGPGTARDPPVVKVDQRCLSCSGQAPMVLSAFKMACLQYEPSKVDHGGEPRERMDLLEELCQKLSKARELFKDGSDSGTGRPGNRSVKIGAESQALSAYADVIAGPRFPSSSPPSARLPAVSAPYITRSKHPLASTT